MASTDIYCRILNEGQTKLGSMIESVMNIVVGFGVAVVTNIVVLPWFGFPCSLKASLGIGAVFTVVSFVRSYVLRRVFNWIMIKWRL